MENVAIDYSKLKPEDFVWKDPMARAVMYCYRISEYATKSENQTYEEWNNLCHDFETDRKWFHNLFLYMLSVSDKCEEIGYNAYRESEIAKEEKVQ